MNTETLCLYPAIVRLCTTSHGVVAERTLIEFEGLEGVFVCRRLCRCYLAVLCIVQITALNEVLIIKRGEVELAAQNVACDNTYTVILNIETRFVGYSQTNDGTKLLEAHGNGRLDGFVCSIGIDLTPAENIRYVGTPRYFLSAHTARIVSL